MAADVCPAGGITFEDQIYKALALGAPYFKAVGMARAPLAAAMVGKTIGIFVAVETKKEGFKGPKSKREIAQQTFLDEITKRGGIGLFLDNTDDLEAMIRGCRQGRLCTPAAE